MNCNRIREDLPDYLTGHLPEDSRRTIDRHLPECASCRAACDALRPTLDRLGSHRLSQPDPAFWNRFSFDVNERLSEGRRHDSIWIPRVAIPSLAALLLLLFFWRGGLNLLLPAAGRLDSQLAPILSQANEREMEDIYQQYTDKTELLAGQDLLGDAQTAETDRAAQRLLTDETRHDLLAASVDYLPARVLLQDMTADEADAVASLMEKNLNQ